VRLGGSETPVLDQGVTSRSINESERGSSSSDSDTWVIGELTDRIEGVLLAEDGGEEAGGDHEWDEEADDDESPSRQPTPPKPRTAKEVLEKLSEFLTENNLEQQIQQERKDINRKIDKKKEEILQKRETHRHNLNDVHEAYKREIQRENERCGEDLKVTEQEITGLQQQLEELEQLNLNVTSKIPCSQSNSTASSGRMRELLECPVCLEEMRPPKKIFQCSNGHVICDVCKNNPEVRSCPTCRVKFRGTCNLVRNIIAEKLARSTYEYSDEEQSPRSTHTRESNESSSSGQEGYRSAAAALHNYGLDFIEEEDDEREDGQEDMFLDFLLGQEDSGSGNHHRRLASDRAGDQEERGGGSRRGAEDDRSRRGGEDDRMSSPARDLSGLPRLRQAHLFRTYRPNARYIPHHQRRQRIAREEEEGNQQQQQQQQLQQLQQLQEEEVDRILDQSDRIFIAGPRISRRSTNFPLIR